MLLAVAIHDPATYTAFGLDVPRAMTAIDTVNLRVSFTAPDSGRVVVRLSGVIRGAETPADILLGVLEGATVRARKNPDIGRTIGATGTAMARIEAVVPVTGLTPGAVLTWDAACGVERGVAGLVLGRGGANDAVADNATGAFVFEVWRA